MNCRRDTLETPFAPRFSCDATRRSLSQSRPGLSHFITAGRAWLDASPRLVPYLYWYGQVYKVEGLVTWYRIMAASGREITKPSILLLWHVCNGQHIAQSPSKEMSFTCTTSVLNFCRKRPAYWGDIGGPEALYTKSFPSTECGRNGPYLKPNSVILL